MLIIALCESIALGACLCECGWVFKWELGMLAGGEQGVAVSIPVEASLDVPCLELMSAPQLTALIKDRQTSL